MRSLYLRIYLTLVVVLAAFAFGSAWLFQRQIEHERGTDDLVATEHFAAIGTLINQALPPATAPVADQAAALREWGARLRMAIALDNAQGRRIAVSELFSRLNDAPGEHRLLRVELEDGRSLVILRLNRHFGPMFGAGDEGSHSGFVRSYGAASAPADLDHRSLRHDEPPLPLPWPWFGRRPEEALVVLLVLLFAGVAIGAYPVVRRLTRRLENLQRGVERFGAGELSRRVDVDGRDEVAALAASFNQTAGRIEALLAAQKSLLANASHELRSPLARLKMAFAMLDAASQVQRLRLQAEIQTNIAELDQLVEEVLLASRLEGGAQVSVRDPVDLLGVAAEAAAQAQAEFDVPEGLTALRVLGEERLLRRALRNLLENARRYGGPEVLLEVRRSNIGAELRVCDRGPGVPEDMRKRIFEPFFRLPGHAEQAGGVGLGLSLVKQIAERHHGQVRCEARPGGGSVFVFNLPAL